MVEYIDGTCGVHRDGKPVDDMRWPAASLDECITAYLDLCHRGATSYRGNGA